MSKVKGERQEMRSGREWSQARYRVMDQRRWRPVFGSQWKARGSWFCHQIPGTSVGVCLAKLLACVCSPQQGDDVSVGTAARSSKERLVG